MKINSILKYFPLNCRVSTNSFQFLTKFLRIADSVTVFSPKFCLLRQKKPRYLGDKLRSTKDVLWNDCAMDDLHSDYLDIAVGFSLFAVLGSTGIALFDYPLPHSDSGSSLSTIPLKATHKSCNTCDSIAIDDSFLVVSSPGEWFLIYGLVLIACRLRLHVNLGHWSME